NLKISDKTSPSAFITIMQGCNNFCSYCIVPFVRGREKSRDIEDILKEAKFLVENGTREITLLGQNVNSYGKENGIFFPELLYKIAEIKNLKRIRFATSHPKDMSIKLIKTIAAEQKISRQVHLPVQSGSKRILRLMNRRYTNTDYLRLIERIKQVIPGLRLSTDIIVGFPTETRDDFKMTYNLIKEVGFNRAFIFKYSPRPPAVSARMKDDISLDEKKQRHQTLLKLQQEISRRLKK
ncbi:MAG: MiaB/RimO family radical SAM methylthiotransferase, partial [Candidatus Omnitrophota bacterium]|nr:MiaB/RimO family radical SAM methylthiotransferase [Candidatus Omnitrophota bacterium]